MNLERLRTLIGPYEDIEDAFEHVDMGKPHNGVRYLPCPKCYKEVVYHAENAFDCIYESLLLELTLIGFFNA